MFDDSYVPDEHYAGAAFSSYGVDSSWYLDTGATDHMTGELEKLAMLEKYKGKDQILGADGPGMKLVISAIQLLIPMIVNSCLKMSFMFLKPTRTLSLFIA
jgi:hypothetical protein